MDEIKYISLLLIVLLLLMSNIDLINKTTIAPPSETVVSTSFTFSGAEVVNVFQIEIDIEKMKRNAGSGNDYFWQMIMESKDLTNTRLILYLRFNNAVAEFLAQISDNGSVTDSFTHTISLTSDVPDVKTYILQFWHEYISTTDQVYIAIYDKEGFELAAIGEELYSTDADWKLQLKHYAGSTYDSRELYQVIEEIDWWATNSYSNANYMLTRDVLGWTYKGRFDFGDAMP